MDDVCPAATCYLNAYGWECVGEMDGSQEIPSALVPNAEVDAASDVDARWPGWLKVCTMLGLASLCWLILAGLIVLLARVGSMLLMTGR